MKEIVFKKSPAAYHTEIHTPLAGEPVRHIILDTGSPLTVISIPSLLLLVDEGIGTLRKKIDRFIQVHGAAEFGGYDMQTYQRRFQFIPYIIKELRIGDSVIHPFMFWLNVSNYMSRNIKESSILFGLDYFNQAKKGFDENDDCHISFENGICYDTGKIGAALKSSGEILRIESIKGSVDDGCYAGRRI